MIDEEVEERERAFTHLHVFDFVIILFPQFSFIVKVVLTKVVKHCSCKYQHKEASRT